MKKYNLLVVCMLLVMASCKKDEETIAPQTKNPMTENIMSEVQSKIVSFLEIIKNYENGEKSNETMTYDEAVLLWENTLNYCHSFTTVPVEGMQFDTIYMKIDCVNGEIINTADAVGVYNNLVENVREVYTNINIDNKKLHYVMVDRTDYSKGGGDEIEVVILTGSESYSYSDSLAGSPWYGVPFDYNFSCHSGFFNYRLEQAIRDYDNSHRIIYSPGPNMITVVHSYGREYYFDDACDWVYNGANDSILPYYVANQLYADAMIHTHTEDMIIGEYGKQAYFETLVKNNYISHGKESLSHLIEVYFATREWRYDPGLEGEYPSDIDDNN